MDAPTQVARYRVEARVAQGAVGVVYRACDPEGRPVALKMLLAGRTASPLQRLRFATEVQSLLRLRHPHVIELLDAGVHEGTPFLAMQWVEGETLGARLARAGPLEPRDAIALVQALASALEYCHAQGVLHRDLKPDNVLLRAGDDAPLLTDFGLSKDAAGGSERSVRTKAGCFLGTPGWWPPEQARGELAAVGPRSDVYGLGAILYACLTGAAPQAGETAQEMIAALERPTPPPSQRRPWLPPWLDAACLRALAHDPALRPESPAALARELAAGQAAPQVAPPPGRAPRPARPLRGLVLAAALGLVVSEVAYRAAGWIAPAPAAADVRAQPAPPVPSPPEEPPAEAFARGLRRLEGGDLAGAREELDRAVEQTPGSAAAWYNRGLLRLYQQDPEGACQDLDRALALDPFHARAYLARGNARQDLGQLGAAREDYDAAIELAPGSAAGLVNRGTLSFAQGKPDEALADLAAAVALEPTQAEAHLNLGLVHTALGDPERAIADFERCLALAPDAPWAAQVRAELERLRASAPR